MKYPYFCFWPERYWLDTYDLSDAEHGRYLRLLIIMWNAPRCRIPNDPVWICSKMGRSVQAFDLEIKPILLRFCKTDGNSWCQPKLLEEFEGAGRRHARASAGGKALAHKKNSGSLTPARFANPSAAPTPTPTKKEHTLANGVKVPLLETNGHKPDLVEFDKFWSAYPNRDGKQPARKAFEKAIKQVPLAKMLAAIEQQRKSKKWIEGYVMAAARWLKECRWEDESAQKSMNWRDAVL